VPFLLAGLYQILLMDSITPYAAVNETVEAAKVKGRGAAGFVNAVLRNALRDLEAIRKDLKQQKIGIRESHPDVLVTRWTAQFGPERALALCQWNNTRPQITVHPHCEKENFASFLASLRKVGIEAEPHPFAPDFFLTLPAGVRIPDLPGFSEGLFGIQDPSTLKAIELLDPQPGEFILDACAAPGGKTSLIAERMEGRGEIVAMDIQEDRLDPLRENIGRMRLNVVRVARGDAASEADVGALRGNRRFDRILLDVPCTNTGVLRRRPDARWRFSSGQLSQITRIQRSLLDNAARFLKPGGTIVYSTCSLEPEEDELMVQTWLSLHPRFKRSREAKLFPPETLTDGIYAASIELTRESKNHHQ
jgi:16S rRNA (cytosine967-C5)-methyltransferase